MRSQATAKDLPHAALLPRVWVALALFFVGCGDGLIRDRSAAEPRPDQSAGTEGGELSVSAPDVGQSRPLSVEEALEILTMPEGLESESPRYAQAVVDAQGIMHRFADTHGWSEAADMRTFDRIEVHDSRQSLWARVLELYDAPDDTPMPGRGAIAAVESRILLCVTEEEYGLSYPEYAALPQSLERVLAHEMVHRLHVQVLHGDEDAMGPRWFYEGLAVLGSGQDFDLDHEEFGNGHSALTYRNAAEALAGTRSDARPEFAYRRYAAALRYFMRSAPLTELVREAASADFEERLLEP